MMNVKKDLHFRGRKDRSFFIRYSWDMRARCGALQSRFPDHWRSIYRTENAATARITPIPVNTEPITLALFVPGM